MKIRVDKADCKFIVKPEERKVICIWYVDPEIVYDYITRGLDMYANYHMCEKLRMRHYYTGIASCAPEDEWNEELGKNIAFSKMKKKFCSTFFRRVNRFFNDLDEQINRAIETCDRMGEKWNKEVNSLDKEIESKLNK